MPEIVTVPDLSTAAQLIASVWEERARPKIIRLEGFCGVGKSTVASELTELIAALHLEADEHVDKFDEPIPPFAQCVRQTEFDLFIKIASLLIRPLVLDAVCLGESRRARSGAAD